MSEKIAQSQKTEKSQSKSSLKKTTSRLSFQNDFYSDLNFPDQLYALIIRSPTHKGIIRSITIPDISSGYYLFTARDVPGKNIIDTPLGKVPVFSEGNISYLGEPLGILVGPDQIELNHLAKKVEIIFDTTPIEQYFDHIKDESSGKKIGSQELFSPKLAERKITWGPCFSKKTAKGKEPMDKIFAKCAKVLTSSYTYTLKQSDYLEPHGAICSYDKDEITVYTPTTWLTNLRYTLSETLKIKTENIVIKKTKSLSTSTNSIWYNSIIASQVAVAALKTKKTVKLVYSRKEENAFMNTMQPVTITHKSGLSENGKILGMQVDIDLDAGAYNPFSKEILDRLIIASAALYKAENLSITATSFSSKNPPSSIDFQSIDAAAFFAFENHLNRICSKLEHVSPIEIRKLNFYTKKAKEKNSYPFDVNVSNMQKLLDELCSKSDFNRKWSSYNLESKKRNINFSKLDFQSFNISPMRGIGLACAFEGSTYYGSEVYGNEEYIETTLEKDNSVTIHTSPVSSSIQEIWQNLVSSLMGIKTSQVKFNTNFSPEEEPPLPEIVHNNISVMTELLTKCCDAMKHRKEDEKLPYTVKRKISVQKKNEWNIETFSGKPFHSICNALSVIELEVDPYTFREKIKKLEVILSCGKILNKKAAENNVRLNVERVLSSLVQNDTIRADKFKITFIESDENPCKLGEVIYKIIPASYTEALNQALNCSINTIPINTNTIYDTISYKNTLELVQKESKSLEKEAKADENSNNS